MFSHYSVASKIKYSVQCLQWDRINYYYSIRFLRKLLQLFTAHSSPNVYSKFLDFLFTFPVQVLEDERIEGNYCLWYFEAEKAYLRLINFFVCIIKSLVWSFLEEIDREGKLNEMNK